MINQIQNPAAPARRQRAEPKINTCTRITNMFHLGIQLFTTFLFISSADLVNALEPRRTMNSGCKPGSHSLNVGGFTASALTEPNDPKCTSFGINIDPNVGPITICGTGETTQRFTDMESGNSLHVRYKKTEECSFIKISKGHFDTDRSQVNSEYKYFQNDKLANFEINSSKKEL